MKKKYFITALILLCVAIIIALFSYNTVWLGDDINYAFDFREGHRDEIVSSFSQIIQSMNAHYMTVNGRHMPHILVQLFCGIWGHLPFAIANGIAYIVFIMALCKLCYVKLDNIKGVLTVTLFALIVFQTKMVPSCQIGYIWTFDLAMIFLIVFFSKWALNKWWQILLLGLFSLIAGNGNEALTLGISGALVIFWFKNMHKMTMRQYVMMICFGIGTLVICLSPGTTGRATSSIGINAIMLYNSFRGFFSSQIASFVMLAIIIWHKYKTREAFKGIYSNNAFYFNIWAIMIAVNIIIGFASNRQIFGAELSAIIISIRLLRKHTFNLFWLTLSSICLISLYVNQTEHVLRGKATYNEIERQFAKSNDGIVYVDINNQYSVPYTMAFCPHFPIYGTADSSCGQVLLEKWFASYYPEKNTLRILPPILKGLSNKILDNGLYALKQPGLYLFIQNHANPQHLYVNRKIDKFLFHKDYKPLMIDISDKILCNGNGWQACYININDYSILDFSHNSIQLQ